MPRPAAAISSSTRSRSRCCAIRPSATRSSAGQRAGRAGRSLHRQHQRRRRRVPGRGGGRRAYVPRQFQGSLSRRRRLRVGRRALLRRHQRQSLPARIRHATRRRLRAAALRAEGQGRGARASSARRRRCSKASTRSSGALDEATRYIDLDRLAISPQCGFASTVAGNPLTEEDERRSWRWLSKRRANSGAQRSSWKGRTEGIVEFEFCQARYTVGYHSSNGTFPGKNCAKSETIFGSGAQGRAAPL